MKFKRQFKYASGLEQIDMAPLIDCIFLLLIFFMLSSTFTYPSGIHVQLPKAITSDVIKEDSLTVAITSENIVYLNGKVVTMNELRDQLKSSSTKDMPVMIKADRRSSMGRIVDVWDLCRELGIERINIATNREQ